MRLLADLHIAPRTVQFLRQLGHDVARVSDLAPPTLPDVDIVSLAIHERRVVLDPKPRLLQQDAEKVRYRRSRFAQKLNVPKRTPSHLRSLRPC